MRLTGGCVQIGRDMIDLRAPAGFCRGADIGPFAGIQRGPIAPGHLREQAINPGVRTRDSRQERDLARARVPPSPPPARHGGAFDTGIILRGPVHQTAVAEEHVVVHGHYDTFSCSALCAALDWISRIAYPRRITRENLHPQCRRSNRPGKLSGPRTV